MAASVYALTRFARFERPTAALRLAVLDCGPTQARDEYRSGGPVGSTVGWLVRLGFAGVRGRELGMFGGVFLMQGSTGVRATLLFGYCEWAEMCCRRGGGYNTA